MVTISSAPSIRRSHVLTTAPGLLLAVLLASAAQLLGRLAPSISPLLIAVGLGTVVANTSLVSPWVAPGLRLASKRLLRLGVVLLGFRLSLADVWNLGLVGASVVALTVATTLLGIYFLGCRLRLGRRLSVLLATGFAICGVSAVAAMSSTVDAEERDVAVSITLVTLCGTVAAFGLPLLAHLFGMDDATTGRWIGAGIHDVGQVIAAGSAVSPAALDAAIVVKLCRVMLLGPLLAGSAVLMRRSSATATRQAPIMPLFVVGFVAASFVRSAGVLGEPTLDLLRTAEGFILATALAATGTAANFKALRRVGGRPILVAGAGLVLVTGVAGLAALL